MISTQKLNEFLGCKVMSGRLVLLVGFVGKWSVYGLAGWETVPRPGAVPGHKTVTRSREMEL